MGVFDSSGSILLSVLRGSCRHVIIAFMWIVSSFLWFVCVVFKSSGAAYVMVDLMRVLYRCSLVFVSSCESFLQVKRRVLNMGMTLLSMFLMCGVSFSVFVIVIPRYFILLEYCIGVPAILTGFLFISLRLLCIFLIIIVIIDL